MTQEVETIQNIYTIITEFVVQYSFQILGAIIILIIGIKVAGWISRTVVRLCERKELDVTLTRLLGSFIRGLVITFAGIIALGKFGITIAPFVAAIGALAFGGSFAIQGPLSNYGAGISIILTRYFLVGDTISVKGVTGVVEEIRLGATILSTEDGEQITVPNKHIVGEIIHNSRENRVFEGAVGISYSDDPQTAIVLIKNALATVESISGEPSPQVGIQGFGESSIDLGYRLWVPTKEYFDTVYKGNQAIYDTLLQNGITIPFPQRDVRLHGTGLEGDTEASGAPRSGGA